MLIRLLLAMFVASQNHAYNQSAYASQNHAYNQSAYPGPAAASVTSSTAGGLATVHVRVPPPDQRVHMCYPAPVTGPPPRC